MKTLFITPHGDLMYGGEKSLLLLLRELRSREVDALVACGTDGVFVRALQAEGFKATVTGLANLTKRTIGPYLLSVWRMAGIVRQFRPDIVHCNSASVAQIAVPVAGLHGIPTVIHLRNDLSYPEARRYLIPKASAIIANSSFTGTAIKACIGQQKWHVVHNPIEITAGNPAAHRADNPMVLFVGQICPHKGVDTFIRVVAELKHASPKPTFVIVGDEPYHAPGYLREMKNLAETLKVMPLIEFAGHITDVMKYYANVSLVVVPSRKEPFGRVAAEAMMAGRPVVASRVGGLPEVVEDNVTGFLVEPDNVGGFATKVQFLLNNPDKAIAMGRAGRERAKRLFSPQGHADKVMEVYNKVLA